MRIGYACLNLTLSEAKIKVNRSMVKRTFLTQGISYASELALKNVMDLEALVNWNIANDFLLYRMSSDMFPWMSEYELDQLPDYGDIQEILSRVGKKVNEHNLRLTFHPGPFNVLASPNEDVLRKTSKELRQHGEIMDLLCLPRTHFAKINIHIGGAYGDKVSAIKRFVNNFNFLPVTAKQRLTIENDDRASMFSVKDLMEVHHASEIPIVFDYLHHQFCTGGWTEEEAMLAALSTWPKSILPIVHYSSSKKMYEDPVAREAAHADYVYENINFYGRDVDVVLEAKAKEKAIIQYLKDFIP